MRIGRIIEWGIRINLRWFARNFLPQADSPNGMIRRVFSNATIVAIVGNGSNAPGSDGRPGASPSIMRLVAS